MMVTMVLGVMMMAGRMMRGVMVRVTARVRGLGECDRYECEDTGTHAGVPSNVTSVVPNPPRCVLMKSGHGRAGPWA